MWVHGKTTGVTLDGDDLSDFTTNSQLSFTIDSHDVTTYGKGAHVFHGGLRGGTATISGIYDDGATGPRDIIMPLWRAGVPVAMVHRPEGTGTGLPQDTVDVLITNYQQTHPVVDMVTWQIDLQFSDDVDSTPQA